MHSQCSHTWPLSPLETHLGPLSLMTTTPASDAPRRALGSSGTQVGSHQAGQVFPAAWAGPGWGQGPGLGCRACQQRCGLSQDAHTCADLPGAGASTVAAPSILQLIVGSSCQARDASRTFLECRGSPRRGKAGRPRQGPHL